MHSLRTAVVVEKTCKIWRTTRAQHFECYCREFETDTGVNWLHIQKKMFSESSNSAKAPALSWRPRLHAGEKCGSTPYQMKI